MRKPTPLPDADRRLIDEWLDDGLVENPVGAADILNQLDHDSVARDWLIDRAMLHVRLRKSLCRRSLAEWSVPGRSANVRASAGRVRAAAACVAAVACALVMVVAVRSWSRPYAMVTSGVGAADQVVGESLYNEFRELAAGVLQLETRRGAQLVIEAPAAFRFESPQRLRLIRGRISAEVPERAKGFTVVTPSGEAVDLGTRFAVDVPSSGEAEVHVFDGEVVACGDGHPPTSLRGGEAMSLATNSARDLRSAAFIRLAEVPKLAAGVAAGQELKSRSAISRLRDDPALLGIVDFEEPGPPGDSVQRRTAGQYRLVQGRWPGSKAAEFKSVGDHLPLDVGGGVEWPQITLMAWVRLDHLGDRYQSLYHTDDWRRNPGQVHWMIVETGVMRIALPGLILGPDAIEHDLFPESRRPVFGTEGHWVHLAFVYDAPSRTARFYVNGLPDGVTRLAVAPLARLGPARIGNWNQHDRKLSGRIDELVILGRAFDAEEMWQFYESGVPYH